MEQQPPRVPGESQQTPPFDPNASPARTVPRRRQGGPPPRPLAPSPQPNPWLVGIAVATVLGAISVIAFGLFSSNTDSSTADATATTLAAGDMTLDSSTGDTTDGTTAPTTDETADPTTDGTNATLPGGGDLTPIGSVGEPIPISELTMSSNDIGPLDFGDAGNDVLGRLVATFGQPTDDTGFIVGDGSLGECPGDSIRVVRWGPLNIVTRGEASNHVFASYRMDLRYGGITSPTTDMATLSGLRVGQTVGELEDVYQEFTIEYIVDQDVGQTFELRSSPTGALLLWGPVDSNAPGSLVTGIYSPDSCTATS